MQDIQNVVFDFGNVLFDLDLEAINRHFQAMLGVEGAAAARRKLEAQQVFELFETGGMSAEEFIAALRFAGDRPLSEAQVLEAWNAIFIQMPAERFDMLLRLRQRYQVFMLSNINPLHEAWIATYMERVHGISDFESRYFDGVYYSHHIRLRKPDREVYEYLLADAELEPGATVFFDDLSENIEAAKAAGIRGIHKPAAVNIIPVVEAMLLS